MNSTVSIINNFKNNIDINKNYNINELKKILNNSFNYIKNKNNKLKHEEPIIKI